MKRKTLTLILSCLLAVSVSDLLANNISVSNSTLTGQNTASQFALVNFDLSWDNSWRITTGPNNWDAAWVFVKYRVRRNGEWKPATINGTGHTAPAGSTITPATDGTGVFIYRSATGSGTFSLTNVQLRWNYGTDNVPNDAYVDIRVFAIEMVYVPQGTFNVGSGTAGESGRFKNGTAAASYAVTSEDTLGIRNATNKLWGVSTTGLNTIGPAGTLQAAFPKGFAGFYCMKYEISQQQYVDFLNTLTRTQQNTRIQATLPTNNINIINNRYVMSFSSTPDNRNSIRCDSIVPASDPVNFYCDLNGNGKGGESNDGLWIACNHISWMDGAAYTDWAGLRPMTELEYEKACRGTTAPSSGEYAWGANTSTQANNITNSGTNDENSATSNANVINNNQPNVQGPMRVGLFAKATTSTRAETGASFYGIMELSGNLWERTVTVGNLDGRSYTGVHGNGSLSSNGNANVTAWPGLVSGEVTGVAGSGFRGGNWSSAPGTARVSDRFNAVSESILRGGAYGFRAVRTAP